MEFQYKFKCVQKSCSPRHKAKCACLIKRVGGQEGTDVYRNIRVNEKKAGSSLKKDRFKTLFLPYCTLMIYINRNEMVDSYVNVGCGVWRIINSGDMAFEPYSKGVADIKRVLRQKAGEGRFEGLGFLRIPPNGVFPKHNHPEREEIYYVTSGSGTLMIEDKEVAVAEGSVVYVSGDVPHGLSNSTDKTLVVLYVTAFV